MGIQGLIPFLEKASKPTNVSEFSGGTVAIDAYCWLHKGVFSCADRLILGDDCDMYVSYCMKFINMLLSKNVKPILVFDGQRLPAKMETEQKRRELRDQNRKKAAELMRLDRAKEAQTFLRRCIDITHKMALNVIRICRSRNIDCIVAPYEADAQLAFLSIQDIAEAIITEDSDLLLFGAKKVLFKMDVNGNGLLIEQSKLHLAMGVRQEEFSFEKFRYMCILSGCDYLSSLPGIGLVKACRFIKTTKDNDIHRAISRIALHLNMPQLFVTKEYRDRFMHADFMFRHQPVYDPRKRELVPLTPANEDDGSDEKFNELLSIKNLSQDQVNNLAFGNLDPSNLKKLDAWCPSDRIVPQATDVRKFPQNMSNVTSHPSIWDENYVPRRGKQVVYQPPNALRPTPSKTVQDPHEKLKIKFYSSRRSLPIITRVEDSAKDELEKLENVYKCREDDELNPQNVLGPVVKKTHMNPFSTKTSSTKSESKHEGALSKFARLYKCNDNVSNDEVVNSRYFTSMTCSLDEDAKNNSKMYTPLTPSINSSPEIFDSPERSPLKDLNKSLIQVYGTPSTKFTSPKSPPHEKIVDETAESLTESRKRLNPFAIDQQEKKPCSLGIVKKLASFKNINRNESNGENEFITSMDTSSKFRYPQLNTEIITEDELNITKNKGNALSQQSDDEGFYSLETSSLESLSWGSPPKTQSPVKNLPCRFPGLKKKSVAKQLSLCEFVYKPAKKLKI